MNKGKDLAFTGEERDPSMQAFGEYLKRERELRKISLREIVDETKISYRYLEALEEDNRSRLPAEVFVKGFIRSYANYIGLDADEAILRYQEYRKFPEDAGTAQEPEREFRSSSPGGAPRQTWRWIGVILVVVLAGVLLVYGYAHWKGRQEARSPKPSLESEVERIEPPVPEPVKGEEEPAPAPSEEPAPTEPPVHADDSGSQPSVAAQAPISVTLSALEKTWLTVDVDSNQHYDVTLQPDEDLHLSLVDSMRLTVGNAGGLVIHANGRTLGPLGESGQVVKNFLITRKDLSENPSQ